MTDFNSPHWHRLTAAEQVQLLNSHDGSIPVQAMIDAAKTPEPVIDAEYLSTKINALTISIKMAHDDLALSIIEKDESWETQHRATITRFEKRREALRDQLAALVVANGQ